MDLYFSPAGLLARDPAIAPVWRRAPRPITSRSIPRTKGGAERRLGFFFEVNPLGLGTDAAQPMTGWFSPENARDPAIMCADSFSRRPASRTGARHGSAAALHQWLVLHRHRAAQGIVSCRIPLTRRRPP